MVSTAFRSRVAFLCTALALASGWSAALVCAQDGKAFRSAVKEAAPERLPVETPLGKGTLALYVSAPWDKPLPNLTRAVVLVHGLHRNANGSFRVLQEAEKAAGADPGETLLIAPHFLSPEDAAAHKLAPEVIRWKAGSWMGGLAAVEPARINGFDAMDAILARLADRSRFPKLTQVVVAGHSAGGQFVQRYAAVGRGEAALAQVGIHVRYVVANPSSYLYFDTVRPVSGGGFAAFDGAACPRFNRWKYGLENAPGYVTREPTKKSGADLETQYVKRDVVYLLGTSDTNPNHPELDRNCAAELQGPYRYARGQTYMSYLQKRHGAELRHRVWDVPRVAHNVERMMGSACGLAALFDRPGCVAP